MRRVRSVSDCMRCDAIDDASPQQGHSASAAPQGSWTCTTTLPTLWPLSMYSMASGTALSPLKGFGSIQACSLPSACRSNTRFRAAATFSLSACATPRCDESSPNVVL